MSNNATDRKDSYGNWLKSYYIDPVQYRTSAYNLWMGINNRCRAGEGNETYKGTENRFRDFQSFAEWCQHQYGYNFVDDRGNRWHLDKDLFGKHYDPETCVFIPAALNSMLKNPKRFSDLPVGVSIDNSNNRNKIYRVSYSEYGNRNKRYRRFHCAKEAHDSWLENRSKNLLLASNDEKLSSRVRSRLIELTNKGEMK